MEGADFLIVGGGIAGLSAAARLARHGRIVVLEAEDALGYHSSGRSVSFSHYGIGSDAVRALTAHSRPFFEAQPEGFCETAGLPDLPLALFRDRGGAWPSSPHWKPGWRPSPTRSGRSARPRWRRSARC